MQLPLPHCPLGGTAPSSPPSAAPSAYPSEDSPMAPHTVVSPKSPLP